MVSIQYIHYNINIGNISIQYRHYNINTGIANITDISLIYPILPTICARLLISNIINHQSILISVKDFIPRSSVSAISLAYFGQSRCSQEFWVGHGPERSIHTVITQLGQAFGKSMAFI